MRALVPVMIPYCGCPATEFSGEAAIAIRVCAVSLQCGIVICTPHQLPSGSHLTL